MIDRVLVAVDDSRESLGAARVAARLAAGWNASVRVLTVVEDSLIGEAVASVAGPGVEERMRRDAERVLAQVGRDMAAAGVPAASVETMVRSGVPFRRILEEARSWPADLVVMAVSDRRGVQSAYVGSETEHVLEFAQCPVLVVPPPVAGS
ncbi:MAG TPA: universal stress protein [Candidatus Dormibacteraeota bacterium]|nr:universal stress protein [Candidatus Dormibacteraeota bacterium]